jgi:predicted transcriptional regulator
MSNPSPTDDDADTTAFIEAVKQGLASAEAGRTVPYEAVRKWLLSWGTEGELPPPECP